MRLSSSARRRMLRSGYPGRGMQSTNCTGLSSSRPYVLLPYSEHTVDALPELNALVQGFFQSLFTSGFSESTSKFSSHRIGPDYIDIVLDDPNITRAGESVKFIRRDIRRANLCGVPKRKGHGIRPDISRSPSIDHACSLFSPLLVTLLLTSPPQLLSTYLTICKCHRTEANQLTAEFVSHDCMVEARRSGYLPL